MMLHVKILQSIMMKTSLMTILSEPLRMYWFVMSNQTMKNALLNNLQTNIIQANVSRQQ